jgi:hypothetical protein
VKPRQVAAIVEDACVDYDPRTSALVFRQDAIKRVMRATRGQVDPKLVQMLVDMALEL